MTTIGTVSLSRRAFSQEDLDRLRLICDNQNFGQGVFCSVIVHDVLSNAELTGKYVRLAQQFEDDQAPATIAEMKMLKVQLRQYEEELQALRAFKEQAKSGLNDAAEYTNSAYSR